jgi:hypothetical protein
LRRFMVSFECVGGPDWRPLRRALQAGNMQRKTTPWRARVHSETGRRVLRYRTAERQPHPHKMGRRQAPHCPRLGQARNRTERGRSRTPLSRCRATVLASLADAARLPLLYCRPRTKEATVRFYALVGKRPRCSLRQNNWKRPNHLNH